jgi:hypothetical protein
MISWITELKRIGSLDYLKHAIENPNISPWDLGHRWCENCTGSECRSFREVLRICEDGVENIASFSHFLKLD